MRNADGTYTEEAELLKVVMDWLEPQLRRGIKAVRICDRYQKGISDVLICVRGQLVCAELKDDIGEPTVHQTRFIEDMTTAGAICGVCRTLKEVQDLVELAGRRPPIGYRTDDS